MSGQIEHELELKDEELAVFFRIFGQEPKEAMKIAKTLGEPELSFVAFSADIREQVFAQVDRKELEEMVSHVTVSY